MNKENIPVITDREELYNKCENMEQLFDKYYLPLLDKHYSKTYKLQQEKQQLKEAYDKEKYLTDKLTKQLTDEYKNTETQYKLKNAYKNIIDELEQWLEEMLNELKQNDVYDRTSYEMGQIIATECIIAKIEELKGSDNNG